ncbi:hypothetical protein EJ07DRAFT_162400 [Lizonia empirigonia]|nr:hypothetical protein EJ07DRAFT_162400 [Lizonia empirigonia]
MDQYTPEELAALGEEDQVQAGNGKHAVFVSYPDGVSKVLKYLYFSIITYNVSLAITKISILLQYHCIFTLREMRILVYVAFVVVGAWGITTLFTSIFSCFPIDAYWKVADQGRSRCLNQMAVWYTNASVNIVTNLLVTIIPIALLSILTIGYAIKANLAIMCASLPALKPLVVKIMPVFGKLSSNRGRGSSTASANNHTSHRFGSMGLGKSSDDKGKLTSESSASHAQSSESRPSESEQHRRNIYVTKHIKQCVKNNEEPRDSDQEVTAAEFLARGDI